MSFDYEAYERDLKYNNVGIDYGEVLTSESDYPIDLTYGLTTEEYGTITRLEEHLTFNGRTTKEFDMYLIERDAPTPEEFEQHITVPYRQGYIDFSHRNGERVYHGRTLTYVFQIFGATKNERKVNEFNITNWLMNSGETQLVDSHDFDYYYNGKCKSVSVEDDEMNQTMIFTIVFIAQPFKISKRYEGHDVWDDINFELDYFQNTRIVLKSLGTMTYKRLNVGDTMHVGPWQEAIKDLYDEADRLKGFKVKKERLEPNPEAVSNAKYSYELVELPLAYWQSAIIESMEPVEITLWNTGAHKVLVGTQVALHGLGYTSFVVELDGVYHFKHRDKPFKNMFLKPGENKLKVYGYGATIDFKWKREVI